MYHHTHTHTQCEGIWNRQETESGPASWVRGTPAGPHTQKAPVHKVNSRKQQLFRGKIWMQQNVPIVMDSWVLTNVTTTTIKIQNLLKKKKKRYRTYPLPQKTPSCTAQSHPAPQPQATSDQLSVADLFCHFQNSTTMKLYSMHLCFSSLPSVPYSEIHQVVVLLNFFGSVFAVVKYGYTRVCLLLMDIWVVSSLGILWAPVLWRFALKPCLDICFHFSWVNT